MKVCNKCKINKEDKEYYTYYHSTQKKFRTRHICLDCTRLQSRIYKQSNKGKIPQPKPVYKECSECYENKTLDNFYLNAYKNPMKKCKVCYNYHYKKNMDEYNSQRGGSERVMVKPNTYTDKWQKEHVFSVMKAFDWIYDESTGIWNKPGFKENGVFIHMTPTEKPKRKGGNRGGGRKRKSGVYNNVNDIIRLLELGHSYNDVAEVYNCSNSLIRIVITKYRNEQRAK